MNQVAENWKDYECIDAGNGEKLERWKDVILRRPDRSLADRPFGCGMGTSACTLSPFQ